MAAVLAFLIGIAAGTVPPWVRPPSVAQKGEEELSPACNGAPADRRIHGSDDETVGSVPPGMLGAVRIERRIIIRLPTVRPPVAAAAAPPPKKTNDKLARQQTTCLSLKTLRGASVVDRVGILFITLSGSRYQATLERGCRPIDFQSGFYVGSTPDGAVCAGRDMLYARTGMQCTLSSFARVLPEH